MTPRAADSFPESVVMAAPGHDHDHGDDQDDCQNRPADTPQVLIETRHCLTSRQAIEASVA
jgi:hypothetical protein